MTDSRDGYVILSVSLELIIADTVPASFCFQVAFCQSAGYASARIWFLTNYDAGFQIITLYYKIKLYLNVLYHFGKLLFRRSFIKNVHLITF
jgi:hypothetical protein